MNQDHSASSARHDRTDRIAQVLTEVTARRLRGEHVDEARIIADHPQLMPEIEQRLQVLRRVERGLQAATRGSHATGPMTSDTVAHPGLSADAIAGYKIGAEIHRGGQGVVYRALQLSTQREVAIKIPRSGAFGSDLEHARFEREVRILAQMEHPHIVAIHDSGRAGNHAYYVMDYVAGTPLDRFVEGRRESIDRERRASVKRHIRETVALFAQVCEAVNAAHLRGVIHRDLKPSNVLVTEVGVPRVLDFGLAKLDTERGPSSEPATILTETGQFVGTLSYASPEQVTGDARDVDLRTDVYALGVMLYKALTGGFPYDVTGRPLDIAKRIAETEPARPGRIVSFLSDDLETIVLRCLNKSRARRYETAGALARDLRSYLDGTPIEARRDSALYLTRVFVRRHRVAVFAALAFVCVMGLSSISLAYMYSQQVRLRAVAERNEQLALQRAREKSRIAAFQGAQLGRMDASTIGLRLRRDLVRRARMAAVSAGLDESIVAERVAGLDQILRSINFTNLALETLKVDFFAPTHAAIDQQFAEQPLVRAQLLRTLASTMAEHGLLEDGIVTIEEALATQRALLGNAHSETLRSINQLAVLLSKAGQLDAAEPLIEEALTSARRELDQTNQEQYAITLTALHNYGSLLVGRGHHTEAEAVLRDALAARRRLLGTDHPDTILTLSTLGVLLQDLERMDEAVAMQREALEVRQRVLGEPHPHTLEAINNLAGTLYQTGRPVEALALYDRALGLSRQTRGDEHPDTLLLINNRAYLLKSLGRFDEALDQFSEVVAIRRRLLGDRNPGTLNSVTNLASLLINMGRYNEALPLAHQALLAYQDLHGDEHPHTLRAMTTLGQVLVRLGRLDEARSHVRGAMHGHRKMFGNGHTRTLGALHNWGLLLRMEGRLDQALATYTEGLETARRVLGDNHPDSVRLMGSVGSLYKEMGRVDEAVPLLREALTRQRRLVGAEHPATLRIMQMLGAALRAAGEHEAALALYKEALAASRRVVGDDHNLTLALLNSAARAHQELQQWDAALTLRSESLEGYRRVMGADHPHTLVVTRAMSRLLREMGRPEKALPHARAALSGSQRTLPAEHPGRIAAMDEMGTLLMALGKHDEAERWLRDAASGALSLPETHEIRDRIADHLSHLRELREAQPLAAPTD